jgi:hypothetical protein
MQKIAKFVDGWMDGWMDGCAAHYCMQLSPDMKTAVRNSVHAPKMCDLSFSHGLYVQGAGHAQQRTADLSRQCNVPAVFAPSTRIKRWSWQRRGEQKNRGLRFQDLSIYTITVSGRGRKCSTCNRGPSISSQSDQPPPHLARSSGTHSASRLACLLKGPREGVVVGSQIVPNW